jgi:hypothetical protein
LTVTADRNDVQTKITQETLARLKRLPWDVRSEEEVPSKGSFTTVALDVHTTAVRHPEGEIYRATLVIQANIYSGFLGKEVFQGPGPTTVAFGATPAEAVRQALKNVLPQLGPWLDGKVKELP